MSKSSTLVRSGLVALVLGLPAGIAVPATSAENDAQGPANSATAAGGCSLHEDGAAVLQLTARRGGGRGGGGGRASMSRAGPRGGVARTTASRGPRGGVSRTTTARGPGGTTARKTTARTPGGKTVSKTTARSPSGKTATRSTASKARASAGAGAAANRNVNRDVNRNVNRNVNWSRPGNYWWPRGGAVAAGAALGFVTAATAAAWAGAAPADNMCWYYTDASRQQGFWDACP